MDSDDDFQAAPRRPNRPKVPRNVEEGWTWKRGDSIDVPQPIVIQNCGKIIQEIATTLRSFGTEARTHFTNSCFGHFLKLPENVGGCTQAMQFVISREVIIRGGDESELWFRVNHTNIRFSRWEFALVTGLRFGPTDFKLESEHKFSDHSFYSRFLKGNNLSIASLRKRFSAKTLGDNPWDYVKAAKVLLANLLLCGVESHKHTVEKWYWALVEDDAAWESFPWGSLSYQILLHYIKGSYTVISEAKRRKPYHRCGFTTAFLAWIYCAIPQVGRGCGGILLKKAVPRILRFVFRRTNMPVNDMCGELKAQLKPGSRERTRIYWTSIERKGTPLSLQYIPAALCRKTETKHWERAHTKRLRLAGSDVPDVCSPRSTNEEAPSLNDTLAAAIIEGTTENLKKWFTDYLPQLWRQLQEQETTRNGRQIQGDAPANFASSGAEASSEKSCDETINWGWNPHFKWGWKPPKERRDAGGRTPQSDYAAPSIQWNTQQERSTGMWSLGAFGTYEAFTAGEWSAPMFPGIENIPLPPSGHGVHEVTSANDDHIEKQATSLGCADDTIAIPTPSNLQCKDIRKRAASKQALTPSFINRTRWNVGLTYGVGAQFFDDLWKENSSLTQGHINAYLALLHAEPTFAGLRFVCPGVVLTSTDFMEEVRSVWRNQHPAGMDTMAVYDCNKEECVTDADLSSLSRFITGDIPAWVPPKPWFDYKKVVSVANVGGHWVTLQVDFVEHVIFVWDSTRHHWDNETFFSRFNFFRPMARILPRLLLYCGYWDAHPELRALSREWPLIAPSTNNHVVQKHSYNSGLYALKYVEMLLSNSGSTNLTDRELVQFRRRIASTLFKHSTRNEN